MAQVPDAVPSVFSEEQPSKPAPKPNTNYNVLGYYYIRPLAYFTKLEATSKSDGSVANINSELSYGAEAGVIFWLDEQIKILSTASVERVKFLSDENYNLDASEELRTTFGFGGEYKLNRFSSLQAKAILGTEFLLKANTPESVIITQTTVPEAKILYALNFFQKGRLAFFSNSALTLLVPAIASGELATDIGIGFGQEFVAKYKNFSGSVFYQRKTYQSASLEMTAVDIGVKFLILGSTF